MKINGRPLDWARNPSGWIPSDVLTRMDNARKQRHVTHTERTAEYLRLYLTGGGWIWFPPDTAEDVAVERARSLGYGVTALAAR